MKKFLLVLMATVATAAAAQTQVYGRVNATADSTKVGNVTTNGMINDTSHVGFRVTEDLGRGLRATAVIETAVGTHDPVSSADTRLGDRQSTVGLSSRMGSVNIGRSVHSQFVAISDNDSFKTMYGSVAGDIHNLRGLRMSNGVFLTVSPVKGIAAAWNRTHTNTGAEASAYSVSGKLGPAQVTAARFEQGQEKSTVVGANLTVAGNGVFYSYSDNEGTAKKAGHLVGVSRQLGAVTVKGSYGRTNTDVKAYNVGMDYALSKRTSAGVAYRSVSAASDTRQVGVGLTHLF